MMIVRPDCCSLQPEKAIYRPRPISQLAPSPGCCHHHGRSTVAKRARIRDRKGVGGGGMSYIPLGSHAEPFIRTGAGWRRALAVAVGKAPDHGHPAWSWGNLFKVLVFLVSLCLCEYALRQGLDTLSIFYPFLAGVASLYSIPSSPVRQAIEKPAWYALATCSSGGQASCSLTGRAF